MNTRKKILWTYLVPILSKEEITFEEERKRLIFTLFVLAANIVLITFGIHFIIGGFVVDGLINLSMALLFLVMLVIVRQKKDGTGIYRLIPISLGCLFIYFCTYDESHGYRILWVYSYPFVAIYLVGRLEGSLYTLIVFITWLAVLIFPTSFAGAVSYDYEFKLRFTMSFTAVFIITFLLEAIREKYQERMSDDQQKLSREKERLSSAEVNLQQANLLVEKANKELEAKNIQLSNIIENMQDVLYRTDLQGEVIWTSPSCEQMFGYQPEEVIGRQATDFYVNPGKRNELIALMEKSGGSVMDFEAQIRRKDGSVIWVSSNVHSFKNDSGEVAGIEGIMRDTTERKNMEEKLREISLQDGLTGLANRRHFDQFLENEWGRASRGVYPLSLIMIDIDYFKQFNDKYGHQSGDDCLQKYVTPSRNLLDVLEIFVLGMVERKWRSYYLIQMP